MNDGVEIRPMREADLDRVMEIEHASYSTPWPETSFRGLIGRGDASLLVAESDGEIAGYAVCWTMLDQAELGNIAVAPEWRRRGIAQRLLTATIERMREHEVRELYLEVRTSNDGAQRLYTRNGFETVGRRRNYYTKPDEDALVMRRALEAGRRGPAES